MKTALQVGFFILALAAIGQPLWQRANLPARVASHFDARGQADGWSSRDTQTARHVAVVLVLTIIFPALARLQIRHSKQSVLPRRDYWLAPERRAGTEKWLAGSIFLIGSLIMLFLLALGQATYQANLAAIQVSASFVLGLLGGLAVAILALVGTLLIHFGRSPVG